MSKKTRKRPGSTHREQMARLVHNKGLDLALIPIAKLVQIAEEAGVIPVEIGINASWLAKSEWVRHAIGYHDPEEVPEFFNVKIEEKVSSGENGEEEETITVQGYKTPEALDQEEWDQVIATYKKAAKSKQKLYIKVVKLRNEYARQNGWPILPVPRG